MCLTVLFGYLQGKHDEHAKLVELQAQLKEIYQARVAKQTSVDAKPWRQ